MDSFEYALGLYSLLIGLALADVAGSAHRVARNARTVVWDARPPLAALLAALLAIGIWFDLWTVRGVTSDRQFFLYLWTFGELFLLFMLVSASLPDSVEPGHDLDEYYERNRRYFFTLLLLFQISYVAHWCYYVSGRGQFIRNLWINAPIIVLAPAISLGLRFRGGRRWHLVGLSALIAIVLIDRSRYALT